MATYYFDYTNGNDSWNGLSGNYTSGVNGPFKTVSKLPLLIATGVVSPGDKFLFEAGSTFICTSRNLIGVAPYPVNGTASNRIIFDKYDRLLPTNNKPIFTWEVIPVSTDWVRDQTQINGTNVDLWYTDVPIGLGSIPRVTVNDSLCEVTYHTSSGTSRSLSECLLLNFSQNTPKNENLTRSQPQLDTNLTGIIFYV